MSLDDVWGHAQNVRLWIASVEDQLGQSTSKSAGGLLSRWLTRGRSAQANLKEAADLIGKAKVAFVDLEFALHRAGMPQIRLDTLFLDIQWAETGFGTRVVVKEDAVAKLRGTVAADLAKLDQLCAHVEAQQQQRRATPSA